MGSHPANAGLRPFHEWLELVGAAAGELGDLQGGPDVDDD
jgi:hypothetical protein